MLRRVSRLLLLLVPLISIIPSGLLHAENFIISAPTDIWFDYAEPTHFEATTFMVAGHNSDPQLWLYNEAGTLITSNDDYNGLQSHIAVDLEAGRYRLRAGACCGQPDVWRRTQDWNIDYELAFNGAGTMQTTTVVTTTTSTTAAPTTTTLAPTTTTTTLPPTTTTLAPTTTSTILPSTTVRVVQTTTSTLFVPVVSSTTLAPTTTTTPLPTTTQLPTTSTQPVASTTTTERTTTTSSTLLVLPTTTEPTTTTTVPNAMHQDPQVTAAVSELLDLKPTEVKVSQLQSILTPEVASQLTSEQVDAIVELIDATSDGLSDSELLVLAETLTSAPQSVKDTFEAKINVFGGKFDTYVPVGSKIPVGQRRVLNALVATVMAVPAASSGSPRKRKP